MSGNRESIDLAWDTRKLLFALWSVAVGLVAIHVVLNLFHYLVYDLPWLIRQIFDVDEEDSFPTWFSGFLLLFTSVSCGVKARQETLRKSPDAVAWTGLGIGFLLLSIDEIAGMHESLNSMGLPFSWTVPGVILAAVSGGVFLPFLLRLPRAVALRFVIGGLIYLGGALGVEVLTDPYLERDELNTLPYNMWTAVEEFMEIAGVLVFLEGVRRLLVPDKSDSASGSTTQIKIGLS